MLCNVADGQRRQRSLYRLILLSDLLPIIIIIVIIVRLLARIFSPPITKVAVSPIETMTSNVLATHKWHFPVSAIYSTQLFYLFLTVFILTLS